MGDDKMDELRLGPPLDRRFLRKVTAALQEDGWIDASDMTGWLATHGSSAQMIAAIREVWSRTSLPLRDWAGRVDEVEVWFRNNDLRLAVHVSDDPDVIVWQAAPLEPTAFEAMAAAFPRALPTLLRETALSVPGMVVDWFGPLVAPRYLARRLEYVTAWAEGIGEEECERLGFEYPDPKRHLVEVVDNGLGDCYVLGMDGTIYFFDHDACGLVRCSIALERLVEEYFASPQGILDPYGRQWAEVPRETPRAEPLPDPPIVVLSDKCRQLPHLAAVALAVRGCQRAMPGEWLRIIPGKWQPFQEALRQIVERCREVAITGTPLSKRAFKEARREAEGVATNLTKLGYREEPGYAFASLTQYGIPALARACHAISNAEAMEEATGCCDAIYTGTDDKQIATLAAIVDVDYLLSLNLGAPAAVGKPVPPEFFDRPLWPDGRLRR